VTMEAELDVAEVVVEVSAEVATAAYEMTDGLSRFGVVLDESTSAS
jgi:hypothetical protein